MFCTRHLPQESIALNGEKTAIPPERCHIFMIPLKILFNEGEYLDGVTIDAAEVYRRLPVEVPKTSLTVSFQNSFFENGYLTFSQKL